MFFSRCVTLGVVSAHRAGDALSHLCGHVSAEPQWMNLEGRLVVVEGYVQHLTTIIKNKGFIGIEYEL